MFCYQATVVLGWECIAAAVVIPAAVSAIRFTSDGIVSGTTASMWMSSAAVANRGAIAKGTTVTVLQNIGTAGI